MLNYPSLPLDHAFTACASSTAAEIASTAPRSIRWPAFVAISAMSLGQAGAVALNVLDASRELAEVPWSHHGSERPSIALDITEVSTGHIDLAAYAMGRDVGGLRFQPEQGGPWLEIAFTDVSSACGTCT